ncbi:MAG: hypothetical protein ACXWCG_01670 [Flavitalea sp.]
MQNTLTYLKLSAKAVFRQPRSLQSILKYRSLWHRYNNSSSISERLPWICFSAIDQLEGIVKPGMRVFEYGSGGSTLFWSARVSHLVSIEHDKEWGEKMRSEIKNNQIQNVDYFLIEPSNDSNFIKKNFVNPTDYISSDPFYIGKNFANYVKKIDEYPDNSFDIILIDGRARPSCVLHSLPKLKANGFLIVDNTERRYYLHPFGLEKLSWRIWQHYGPVPFAYNFSETTILQKPEK